MNKLLILLLMIVSTIVATHSRAQIGAYTFTAGSGSYTEITNGTAVPIVVYNAAVSEPLPIGFDFVLNGVAYNKVIAGNDGYLSFNSSATPTPGNNLAGSDRTLRPLLAPLWDELGTGGLNTSQFRYLTSGTAGSRIFTAEWKGWRWSYFATANNLSFQVKLYEGINKIEFIYRPETGTVSNGSASIGIAGSSIGAGNFLSLNNTGANPVASSVAETVNLNTKPDSGRLYSFVPPAAPVADISISNLNVSDLSCPAPAFPLSVVLRNGGSLPINFAGSNAQVSIHISGAVTQTLSSTISSGMLAAGATQLVTFSPVNLTASGTYTFNTIVTLPGDANTSNDTIQNKITLLSAGAPWSERFSTDAALLNNGWKNTTWSVGSVPVNNLTSTESYLYRNMVTDTAASSFTTLPVGLVSAGDKLSFDYKVMTTTSPYGLPAAGWGNFKVQISNDCGNTFTTIDTVADAIAGWNFKTYPLTAYAGQYVTVRIVAKWMAGNFFLAFDNFRIRPPSVIDMSMTEVTALIPSCPNANVPVNITMRNNGTAPIDFASNPATISVNITGTLFQNLSVTVNTGVLAPGAVQTVLVSSAGNFSSSGNYFLKPYLVVAGDGDRSNDTINRFISTSYSTIPAPWSEAFATTASPAGWAAAAWTINTAIGSSTNGNSIVKNIYSATVASPFNTVTIGPVAANQVLRFDYRLAVYSSPYNPPGPGWGNFKVQISTNCANAFVTIDSIANAGSGWVNKSYSLAAYDNQFITIRIVPTWASGQYELAFDNFQIFTPLTTDLSATRISAPAGSCPDSAAPVTVTIKNLGGTTLRFANTPATINVNISGASVQALTSTISTDTLAPLATKIIIVSPNANLSTGGTYNLKSYVTIAGDSNNSNDTATASTTINPVSTTTAPWTESFTTTSLPNGWTAPGWSVGTERGANGNPGNNIYKIMGGGSPGGTITTLAIGPLTTNSYVGFDYKISNTYGTYTPVTSGFGNFKVQISTDCGNSFTSLDTVTTANAGWTSKSYSLAAYTGQKIIVRIVASWAYEAYDYAFDNFKIYNQSATDLSLETIQLPDFLCALSNLPVGLFIKNNGSNPIDFANSNALAVAQISGPVAQTFTTTVNSGTIAPGAFYLISFPGTANLSVAGTYTIKGFITSPLDGNSSNDTLVETRTNGAGVPWYEPFADTLPPPALFTNGWHIGAVRGVTGNPGNNIYINLNADTTSRIFQTKAIGLISTGNFLRFDYKLSNAAAPYNPPAAGWGNFVVQLTDCNSNFITIDSITTAANGWISKSYSLASYVGRNVRVQIKPTWLAGNYDLAFDNLRISTPGTCAPPLSAYTDARTDTSVRVNFTGAGNSFIIEYGPYNFTPGTLATAGGGTIVTASGSPVTINGLLPLTGYKFYIRKNCTVTGDGFSSNQLIDSFYTSGTVSPPLNDLPSAAISLTVGASCSGSPYTINGATKLPGEPAVSCSGSVSSGKVVWFKFAAPASGFIKVSTDISGGTLADTKAALFSVTDSSDFSTFHIIACDDDNGTINNTASIFYATGLIPGQYYYVAVDGYNISDTGRFCLQVNEVTSNMIAGGGNCSTSQTLPQHRPDYLGWLSLTNNSGQLIANLRSNSSLPGDVTYTSSLYVNADTIRQATTGEYYLDRNLSILSNFTTAQNYEVQFFLLNTELAALQDVSPAATLSNLNVTRVKTDSICRSVFVSGGTGQDVLLVQNGSGSVNGISWVRVQTDRLSNFYLNPGLSPLPRIYVFNGNGNWSNPANWSNNAIPPAILPANCVIEIKPVAGGQCILDTTQRISSGDKLRIKSGTNMIIPGSVMIQ